MSTLSAYGIHTDTAEYRAHVAVVARRIYIYPTQDMRDFIEGTPSLKLVDVRTNGQLTAQGYLISPYCLDSCASYTLADNKAEDAARWQLLDIRETDTVTEKGAKAAEAVRMLVELGRWGLVGSFATVEEVTDIERQRAGIDLLVDGIDGIVTVQVKCDYQGGGKALGGTGNLFVQTMESNPYQMR